MSEKLSANRETPGQGESSNAPAGGSRSRGRGSGQGKREIGAQESPGHEIGWARSQTGTDRVTVAKTYKLYIGGKFPRSESGRVYAVRDGKGKFLANAAHASRKDVRDAVAAARK